MLGAMRKRRRMLGLAAVAAVAGLMAFAGWRALTPPHQINRASFEQIREGMTLAEVEGILGVPPGRYPADSGVRWTHGVCLHPESSWGCRYEKWFAGDVLVYVGFREDGTVGVKGFSDVGDDARSIPERLRQRLGW
jgi:hypothetical protein